MVIIGIMLAVLLGGCTLVYTSREPALVTTSDWTLVMKFATGQDLGGANSVHDLWTGTFTVNEGDEQAMSIETGSKTYKSSIVDKWADYNISEVRVSFVNDGQEKAYVVFDGRDSDKKSWFSKSRILSSSWEDLNTHSITNYDSIDGVPSLRRHFYMHHRFAKCKHDIGWFVLTEWTDVLAASCGYDVSFKILYSDETGKEKTIDQATADVFAIWVYTNPCLPSDCKNGAICKYKCICKGDYFGTHCENLNGGFSEWGSYGSCSRTCGTGSKTRTRACDDPTPVGTGSDCSGNTSETIPCSTDPCPILCPKASTSFRNNMTNMTSEELMKVIDMLKAELKVDKSKTSLSVRRKTSAKDSRTSAKTIGAVGAVMLAVPFVLVILLDLNSLYQYRSQKSAKRQISPQI